MTVTRDLIEKFHFLFLFFSEIYFLFQGCGHCKKAKPEFVTAADYFKDDIRVELAAIDCTEFATVCSSYSVRGYPTIIYFNYLKSTKDYQGGRTVSFFYFANEIVILISTDFAVIRFYKIPLRSGRSRRNSSCTTIRHVSWI